LFPTVKEQLERIQVADKDEFFECPQEILRVVGQKDLNGIFWAWVWQVQEVSQGNGTYVR
jgi:hypothetical protein